MAAIHGRKGRLYAAITSAGTAEPIAYLNAWTINFATDFVEVTAFGDATKSYVSGIPDASGTFGGYYDTATAQLYTAASDGVARKFYLYPTNDTATTYWFGTALFDISYSSGVADAVTTSGNWKAATAVAKVG
jgi:hypothetical protein